MQVQGFAFTLNSQYQRHKSSLEKSMARLASGDRMINVGDANGADISLSQKFRHRVRAADASKTSVQHAISFLDQASASTEHVTQLLQRMMEIAAGASEGLLSQSDRDVYQAEFEVLQKEVSDLSRSSLFFGKQTIGREGMVSYDANTGHINFWQSTGIDHEEFSRDFSSGALDADGTEIGFVSSEDYTMSDDGRSLFYLGTVSGDPAGAVRLKRYDLESNQVTAGSDLFATGDTLFLDESGELFVNGSGTIYNVEESALTRSTTLLTDVRSGTEFSVYKGDVIYSRTADNAIVSGDAVGVGVTALTGALAFAAGVDHAFSASGSYVAEEVAPGSIRVIDTRTGNEATLAIGAANSVVDLQFNADGDRVYYINKITNAIHYVNVSTDSADNVNLSEGTKVVQGLNANSFNGLDLGGTSYVSTIKYVLAQDSATTLSYEAADLRLTQLGLTNTRVDSLTDATTAIADLQTAMTRTSAERAKLGAFAVKFKHVLNSHENYITNMEVAESNIRDIDVAREAGNFSALQVKQSAAASILAQFNTLSRNVLVLLGQ